MQELNNQIHILANVTLLSNLTLTNITLNPTNNLSWNFTKGFQMYCSIMGYNFISINARESITIQIKRCCLDFAIYCLLTCWFFYWKEFFYQWYKDIHQFIFWSFLVQWSLIGINIVSKSSFNIPKSFSYKNFLFIITI